MSEQSKQAHSQLFEDGIKMRYQVAGKEYVDRSLANGSSEFARPMQEVCFSIPYSNLFATIRYATHATPIYPLGLGYTAITTHSLHPTPVSKPTSSNSSIHPKPN